MRRAPAKGGTANSAFNPHSRGAGIRPRRERKQRSLNNSERLTQDQR